MDDEKNNIKGIKSKRIRIKNKRKVSCIQKSLKNREKIAR